MWLIFIAIIVVIAAAGLNFLIRFIIKNRKMHKRLQAEHQGEEPSIKSEADPSVKNQENLN